MEIDSHTPLKNPKIINKKIPTAIPYGLVLRVPGFERNDGSQVIYQNLRDCQVRTQEKSEREKWEGVWTCRLFALDFIIS